MTEFQEIEMRLAGLFIALAIALSACNTVEGIGRDVKQAGQALEKAAN